MGYFSVWHWMVVVVVLLLLGYPVARILHRLGFSRWWVIAALIPYGFLVGLWVLAFVKWPIQRQSTPGSDT